MERSHIGATGRGTAAERAAAKVHDHEEIYEIGLFVDATRSTRVGASGSRYADIHGDGKVANNDALLVSAWLFF